MKRILPVVLFVIFSFAGGSASAQSASGKTLLWRIDGNGLTAPSYLYGTMHLKDRRLFFFGDSVYKSLEASAGFAMELDPNEMMDSIFSRIGERDTTTLLRKLLDEKKFKSVSKKLEKRFGMPADKISRKQLLDERENWYTKIHKADDMKAVVDLYLYDIAHKQGKWVGGIEDVSDQLGLKDELGKDITIMDYVDDDNDAKKTSYLEKMISLYAAEDLAKIDEMVSDQSQKTKDLLLVNRNIKMAGRMDTMAHSRNSFFAVGAAHLSGETGLINLLQKRGFNLTPVISSRKIAPEKYTYTAKEIAWIKYFGEDSAYTAETPGKPSDLQVQEIIKFKVSADLVTNRFYMTGYSFIGTDEKPEESMDRMVSSFANKGFEKKDVKKVANKGIEGKEMVAAKENVFYRIQVFAVEKKVFIIMAGAEKKEGIYSADAERFLASFTMNTSLAPKAAQWVEHHDEAKAFSVLFPKKAGVDKLKPTETENNFETATYTALDLPSSSYYMVVVSDTKKGFVIQDDSLVFAGKLEYYKQLNAPVTDIRKFQLEGNAAMSFSAHVSNEGLDFVTKLLIISRGNRSYTVAVVTPKGKEDFIDVTRFFRSFKLLPYKEGVWSKQSSPNQLFNTWAPSSFERSLPDTTDQETDGSAQTIQVLAHEPYSTTTYNVNVQPLSKYYWTSTDSAMIADQLVAYFSPADGYYAKENPGNFDSLVYHKAVMNGQVKGYEILVKNATKNYYKRVRILPHGDSTYHLFSLAPFDYITNKNNERFFDEFRFEKEDIPATYLQNKTGIILSDLASADSATKLAAWGAMGTAKFTATDLPLLYEAYAKKYVEDEDFYGSINERISQSINRINDSSTIAFVRNNYSGTQGNFPELKMDMLVMLASQKSAAATGLVKELLLRNPPSKGTPGSLIYRLRDSLQLAASLFPEAARFFGDSLLGDGMLRLADEAIDSNLLKKDILLDNLQLVFATANAELSRLKNDKDYYPMYNANLVNVLEKINSQQAINLLRAFLKNADLDIKQNALLALLKLKQPVLPVEVRKLAADKIYRADFYAALKKIDHQQLFSPEFLTQAMFAESYVYNYASEEDDDGGDAVCKLIGERVATVKGKKQRYYLFKFSFTYDGETTSHLAVCGSFDLDRKKVECIGEYADMRIFYDDTFKASAIDQLFQQYINGVNSDVAPAGVE